MIEFLIAVVVGVLIGLIGSGGAIVAIPALVYLASYSTSKATDAALVLVTVSAIIAVIGYAKKRYILYKDTAVFALSGIIGAFIGTVIHNQLSDQLLLIIFSIVLFGAAISMLVSEKLKKEKVNSEENVSNTIFIVAVVGVVAGFLTGLIGVGGGFVIIPLLSIVLHYKFKFAVGTSVVIILINALSAIVFRVITSNIELLYLLPIAVLAGAGAVVGIFLNGKLNQGIIRKVFVVFVILLGAFTLFDNIAQL